MPGDTQRLSPDEREHLVAYLDDELPAPIRDRLATKLSQSVTARREVESLERSWDLLDLLPRPQTADDFLSRTLDELSRKEGRGIRWGALGHSWRRRLTAAALAIGTLALAFGIGYGVTAWIVPAPTARLAQDLSLARHLDEYRALGGDLDFLKQLDRLPEFNTDAP